MLRERLYLKYPAALDLIDERDPGFVVAEAEPRGQADVIEGAGEVVASLAEVGPAVVVAGTTRYRRKPVNRYRFSLALRPGLG